MPKKLNPGAVIGLVRELSVPRHPGHLAVAGASALTESLRRDLGRDAEPGAVRVGTHHGAAVLVYVLAGPPTEDDLTLAMTRKGPPSWTENDFQDLLRTLGYAGFGWLRPEGVRRQLTRMARDWKGPPRLRW